MQMWQLTHSGIAKTERGIRVILDRGPVSSLFLKTLAQRKRLVYDYDKTLISGEPWEDRRLYQTIVPVYANAVMNRGLKAYGSSPKGVTGVDLNEILPSSDRATAVEVECTTSGLLLSEAPSRSQWREL